MSYDKNNVFAKILRNEIPCTKVFEDENVIAFNDINPKAPIHVLVIPKGAYVSFKDFCQQADEGKVASYFKSLNKVIEILKLPSGFRLIMNTGFHAGEEVPHFHTHILAGKSLGPIVCI